MTQEILSNEQLTARINRLESSFIKVLIVAFLLGIAGGLGLLPIIVAHIHI